jgi:hypothetical protein
MASCARLASTAMIDSIAWVSRRGLVAGAFSASLARAEEPPRDNALPQGDDPTTRWLSALALQAATYAVPVVAMYNLRSTTCLGTNRKVPPNEIWRIEDIASPAIAAQAGYVTPNVNVIYGFGFMDLNREPIILSAPDSRGRYYMIEICDMWSNAFAYVGGLATGYRGGTFALAGAGWQGKLPSSVKRIDCPTRWVELQPRVHVKNAADLAGAREVLRAVTVKGLAQYTGRPAPAAPGYDYDVPRINPNVASSQMQFLDPLQFWEIFSAAMNENPPPESEIKSVLPQFKYLGIELGKPWRRESVNALVLEQMKRAAASIGPMMMPLLPVLGNVANGWIIPPPNVGVTGADYPSRAILAVFGLTSNTPSEAIYYTAVADGGGRPLAGVNRYTMTFKEPMQYIKSVPPGFWSISLYDRATGFTVANPIGRYALGSDDNLKRNPDESFTLFIQQDSPGPEREANWLPAPSGPFYLIIRNYAPVPEVAAALQNPAAFPAPPPMVAAS